MISREPEHRMPRAPKTTRELGLYAQGYEDGKRETGRKIMEEKRCHYCGEPAHLTCYICGEWFCGNHAQLASSYRDLAVDRRKQSDMDKTICRPCMATLTAVYPRTDVRMPAGWTPSYFHQLH